MHKTGCSDRPLGGGFRIAIKQLPHRPTNAPLLAPPQPATATTIAHHRLVTGSCNIIDFNKALQIVSVEK